MPYFAGFDAEQFPGLATMKWLSTNTNLTWCGYYLAPAPNRGPSGWEGQFHLLQGQWGVVPTFVGQQDARTASSGYRASSILTATQGGMDATRAADLAVADGFPQGTYVYLEWEYGALEAEGAACIAAWVAAMTGDGRVMPGIYCSHVIAEDIEGLIAAIRPTPPVRLCCWRVWTTDKHTFIGDLGNIPAVDPAGCGFEPAIAWQREQNADVAFPRDAPITSKVMDLSTSWIANPGAPAG